MKFFLVAIAVILLSMVACSDQAKSASEVVLRTSGIDFGTAWLACGLDRTDIARLAPGTVESRCEASQYIDTAHAYRDQHRVLHVSVTGARPAFYAITDDQVTLVSTKGKVMVNDCELMSLELPIVTFYDVMSSDPAFNVIARDAIKLLGMLKEYAVYRPKGMSYRPFAGFTVEFSDPQITIDFGEKRLRKKLSMIPGLIRKAAISTGFPARAVLVDSAKGTWAALSTRRTGNWRHR